jgi:hypothetical protein
MARQRHPTRLILRSNNADELDGGAAAHQHRARSEATCRDLMGSGGEARPQVKRGQVSFGGASSDEKKALARASRGACQAQNGRGVSAANRRRMQIQIFALAKKGKGSRPSGHAQRAFAG